MFFPNNFRNCSGGTPPFPFLNPMMMMPMMNPEDMEEMTKEMEKIAKKIHEKQQENPNVHPLFQFLNNPESMQEVAKDFEEMAKKFSEKHQQKQRDQQDQKPAAEEKAGEGKPSSKCANNFFDFVQNMEKASARAEKEGDEKHSSKCVKNSFFDFVQNMAEEVQKNIPEGNTMEEEVAAELFPNKNKTRWNEADDTYTFEMEVPGVRPHQVVIEEKGGDFEINAIRIHSNEVDIEKTYRETFYVAPSKADIARTFATLMDGILTITVPKKDNKPVDLVPQKGYAPPPVAGEEFRTTVDMPGVKISDLKTQAHKGKVWVRGTRQIGSRKVAIKRVIEVQPPTAPMEGARVFLQDGVFTLVVPLQKGGVDDEEKPAAMRVFYVAQDEVPMDFAPNNETNPWADSKEENAMLVETVTVEDEDSKEGWDQVEASAEANKTD